MSVAIEMEPPISLDRLPPDIMRRIVHLESDAATEMRFISRSWNTVAKKYLELNPKLSSPLERVYLSSGIPEDTYKEDEFDGDIHMYAILPERHSKRIGVGGWLDVHQKHGRDHLEVTRSSALSDEHTLWRIYRAKYFAALAGLSAELLWVTNSEILSFGLVIFLSISICICLVTMVIMWIMKARGEQVAQFGRMFSMFTHIETLVLDNFRIASNDETSRDAIDIVLKELKGVRIKRLEVRENYLNKRLQKRIIKLCLDHNIRHVHVSVQDMDVEEFRKFLHILCAIGVTLDVYERNGLDHPLYFTQSRQWWGDEANYQISRHISLRMATVHDDSFDQAEYRYGVKSHIRIEKDSRNIWTQPLKAVQRQRSFNHRWD